MPGSSWMMGSARLNTSTAKAGAMTQTAANVHGRRPEAGFTGALA
ncbi:hypothetical protein QFZ70_001662 [Arthrobacter sp. V1I9]|nr:hypothetical protein [Arthrobacter sp. V1I9]MDQ0869189.1 hypothetical protein [Arthrobacter sp. V1I9]